MAALDFPANPINGQTYSLNGVTYYYNSSMGAWLTQLTSMNIASSSNTQVLFNDAGIANGSSGLTYNKTANTLYANTVNVSGYVYGNGAYLTGVLSNSFTDFAYTGNLNLGLSTSAFTIPAGTTAQRPSTPAVGMTRYNSTNQQAEYYNTSTSAWMAFGSGNLIRAPQVLTSGTSYTTPSNCTKIYVECVGGGGGGGRSNMSPASACGGGGGGGGYTAKLFTVTPSTAYTYAIGAGGSSDNTGGSTTFTVGATTITASGGTQGSQGNNGPAGFPGGSGGAGSGGDINTSGNGGVCAPGTYISGAGGGSFFGGGGYGIYYNQAGINGNSGGGGSGGAGNQAGGAGGTGLIRIWEFQ